MKILNLCYGIQVVCDQDDRPLSVHSGLSQYFETTQSRRDHGLEIAIHTIEGMVLSHASCGVNVESPAYIKGIEAWVEALAVSCFGPLTYTE